MTREYLKNVVQGGFQLPDGPVIMSPDRLFQALHREVVRKNPQEFKIACLKDVQSLFPKSPFYAGFGNRYTDVVSYQSVGVLDSRIFTINPAGDIKLELLRNYKSSYEKLTDMVHHIFPPCRQVKYDGSYDSFSYWRSPLPDYNFNAGTLNTQQPAKISSKITSTPKNLSFAVRQRRKVASRDRASVDITEFAQLEASALQSADEKRTRISTVMAAVGRSVTAIGRMRRPSAERKGHLPYTTELFSNGGSPLSHESLRKENIEGSALKYAPSEEDVWNDAATVAGS